jgi:hypothetical protein
MRKWYGYVFSKESSPVKKSVSTCPRSSQVVNGSRIGKCNNYYQFIMKAEGMKNHGVRIMHALQTLSPVFYMWGCAMENLQFDSKHPVAMNSLFSGTIPPSSRLVINFRCSDTHFSRETRSALCLQFPLPVQVDQNSLPVHLSDTPRAQNTYWSCHGDLPKHKERCAEQQNFQVQAPK